MASILNGCDILERARDCPSALAGDDDDSPEPSLEVRCAAGRGRLGGWGGCGRGPRVAKCAKTLALPSYDIITFGNQQPASFC